MPEVVIKYKKPETLKILKGLAKYLDFTVSKNEKTSTINGVTILPRNTNIDVEELREIFSGKNIDSAELRKTSWQRKK